MKNLKILNSKEAKHILNLIKEQWGCDFPKDYTFLQREDDKVFISNKDLAVVDFSKLRVNTFGMYFAEVRHGEIRLSIEGAQLVGPNASKNVIEVTPEIEKQWFAGEDLESETDCTGFVILRAGNDYLGSGKVKEGKILNFMPKTRRLNLSDSCIECTD